jgi:heme exporter protein D
MTFAFGNLQDFLQMDGHGFYVWLSYGIALVVVSYLVATPMVKTRRFYREHRQTLQQYTTQTTSNNEPTHSISE